MRQGYEPMADRIRQQEAAEKSARYDRAPKPYDPRKEFEERGKKENKLILIMSLIAAPVLFFILAASAYVVTKAMQSAGGLCP